MFNSDDFKVFDDPTLEGRLDKIRKIIDPKFEVLGEELLQKYQANFDEQLYVHIAKHLRRHKNPPPDTWMAISTNKRGYKAYPHLEIGFWSDCIFTNVSFLTELLERRQVDEKLRKVISYDKGLGISTDHTNKDLELLTSESFEYSVNRYINVKSADLVIGYIYSKETLNNGQIKKMNELFKIFKETK